MGGTHPVFKVPLKFLTDYIDKFGIDLESHESQKFFQIARQSLQGDIQRTGIENLITNLIDEADQKFYDRTGFRMLMSGYRYEILYKEYESVVNKCYRLGCELGDISRVNHLNWYSEMDDLARSTIVCRYIDNPKEIVEHLSNGLRKAGYQIRTKRHEKDRGYYAYHLYVDFPFETVLPNGIKQFTAPIEIQVTTQLQEVLYDLTHTIYEDLRNGVIQEGDGWKWEIANPLFKSAYMSHTLHFLESSIVELRKEKEKK